MSYMACTDHIAITSGNTSTTRREFLLRDDQVLLGSVSLRVILAILIVASGQIREYCPASSDLRPHPGSLLMAGPRPAGQGAPARGRGQGAGTGPNPDTTATALRGGERPLRAIRSSVCTLLSWSP